MEDYSKAYDARRRDVDELLKLTPPHATIAAHLAGVAVECRLKALILAYHRIGYWEQACARPKDPRLGQPIARPGHGLLSALRVMDDLYRRAKADGRVLTHLSRLMHPTGATGADFIELRYLGTELDPASLNEWRKSLEYVLGWLKKNEGVTT